MMDPFDNGTGFGFYLILPFTYKFGLGIAVGGSGALADALVRCFEDHGGTIRLNSEIERILLDGQPAKGGVLHGGEATDGRSRGRSATVRRGAAPAPRRREIGRATCRERVCENG